MVQNYVVHFWSGIAIPIYVSMYLYSTMYFCGNNLTMLRVILQLNRGGREAKRRRLPNG
ncbi:hypothetical protein TNCV_4482081 [Trichonephila clavipes]|nr:hypothetical protein TNCV_4482081 [Trichonephila clavipes]